MNMRIGVMGAGAVGGYFGGMLASAGEDVTFLTRPARAAVLRAHGLSVRSVYGNIDLEPKVVTVADELAGSELVLIALKNYHLDSAWPDIVKLVEQGTVLLPLLNGVQHMDRFLSAFGPGQVLGGSCYVETTLSEQGHILQTSEVRDIIYGPLPGADVHNPALPTLIERLGETFAHAHIPAFCREPILRELWKKYVFLCAFSGVTATTRSPIGVALDYQESAAMFVGLVEELLEIALQRGIGLSSKMRESMLERALGLDPHMTSSLHRDLEKGLPLEVGSLQGALVEMAEEMNVPVPWHRAVCAALAPYREGR